MDADIVYFVLLLVVSGCFVWLLHKQQTLTIEKLSMQQRHTIEKLTALQSKLNDVHVTYQQDMNTVRMTVQAEFTRLAQVTANMVKEWNVRDKLFAQFADQIKIECATAVGDAAAHVLGTYKESVDKTTIEHRAGARKPGA